MKHAARAEWKTRSIWHAGVWRHDSDGDDPSSLEQTAFPAAHVVPRIHPIAGARQASLIGNLALLSVRWNIQQLRMASKIHTIDHWLHEPRLLH